jgi:hypothetical protein
VALRRRAPREAAAAHALRRVRPRSNPNRGLRARAAAPPPQPQVHAVHHRRLLLLAYVRARSRRADSQRSPAHAANAP